MKCQWPKPFSEGHDNVLAGLLRNHPVYLFEQIIYQTTQQEMDRTIYTVLIFIAKKVRERFLVVVLRNV